MSRARINAAAVGTFILLLAASWGFQLYSVPDPWQPYAIAVREYLGAGLRGDSAALASRSDSRQAVVWLQDAVRRHPATVAAWAQQLNAVTGLQEGETVTVALAANQVAGCSHLNSVVARLLNHSTTPRLLGISSGCIRSDVPPLLPYQRQW
jgi:hypothetical protein